MKNIDLKKQLKKDIENLAPSSNFDNLMEKCQENVVNEKIFAMNNGEAAVKRKSYLWLTAFVLLAIIAVFLVFLMNGPLKSSSNEEQSKAPFASSGHLILDINPSIEIAYDENGIITSSTGLNEDGDVVLVGIDIVGKNYKEAIEILFKRCINLGYFSYDREDNAILATAVLENGDKDEVMSLEIQSTISNEFSKQKIYGVVIEGTEKEELREVARAYGISAQKYEYIMSYIDMGGELEENQFKDISMRELYDKISGIQEEIKKNEIKDLENKLESKKEEINNGLLDLLNDLIDEIEDAIDRIYEENSVEKEFYKNQIKSIEDYIDKFDNTTAPDADINKIISMLETMNNFTSDETLKAYIKGVISKINGEYEEFIEINQKFDDKNKTPEDISNAREDKFSENEIENKNENADIDKWQEEKREEIISSWDDIKNNWQNDRKEDLNLSNPSFNQGEVLD